MKICAPSTAEFVISQGIQKNCCSDIVYTRILNRRSGVYLAQNLTFIAVLSLFHRKMPAL